MLIVIIVYYWVIEFGTSHDYNILIKGTKKKPTSYSSNIEAHEYYVNESLIFVSISASWYANIFSIFLILLIFLCPITFVYCCILYCGLFLFGPQENKTINMNSSDDDDDLEILV